MKHSRWYVLVMLLTALVLVFALAACGDDDNDNEQDETPEGETMENPIAISDPWVRSTVPVSDETEKSETERVTGAYMGIANHGEADQTLVSVQVSPDIATTVELHETILDDNDVMQMRPVDSVVIPADGNTVLKPGGYHLMLLDVQRDLNPGDTVELTLTFESGIEMVVNAEVRDME
jgi:copper(I)-binding protein